MTSTITKYNSVIGTLAYPLPAWVTDEDDQVRIAAYDAYLDLYRNVPDTLSVSMRGSEDNDKPLYIPSSKKIVEAVNRYLGKGWNWVVTSATDNVDDATTAQLGLAALFTRNHVPTAFYGLKRNMVTKGDAIWHVFVSDLSAPAGQRVSVMEIDPRTCFRIPNPTNSALTDGWYIVNLITADDGKTLIAMRQEYRRQNGGIMTRLSFWEQNGWDDRWVGHPALKPVAIPEAYASDTTLTALLSDSGTSLPASVTSLPIYHVINNRESGEPWGSSELQGMETLVVGINQSLSDEDISLALQGLGMYTTTSTRPVDGDGNEVDWIIQPGYVAELKPGTELNRVEGVKTVVPFQDHMKFIEGAMEQSAGLSDVAVGRVDVQVAQSGIALRLELAPILARNEEKEAELLNVLDEMTNDLLHQWLPIEGVQVADDVSVSNSFGDPLPVDRAATVAEVKTLVDAGLMSKAFAIAYLKTKLGYDFPDTMLQDIASEEDAASARIAGDITDPSGGVPVSA